MVRMPGSCHCHGRMPRHQRHPSCLRPSFHHPSCRRPSSRHRHEDRCCPCHGGHRHPSCQHHPSSRSRREDRWNPYRHVGRWSSYRRRPCPYHRRPSFRRRQNRRHRTCRDLAMQIHSNPPQNLHLQALAYSHRGTRLQSSGSNAFHLRPGSDRSEGFHLQVHAGHPCYQPQGSTTAGRYACCCHRMR